MAKLQTLLILVFVGLTLLGQGFQLLFRAVFYDRSFEATLANFSS